ncbi:hypothetical protein ACFE04_020021 [Oxalis oulophora]
MTGSHDVANTKIPMIGYGTAEYPLGSNPEIARESILHAIKVGYRHFDTAAVYQSEKPLGEAIAEAISRGFIKSRDELFITSKLWCKDGHHHLVLPALQQTLKNLRIEFLDLYIIHFPVSIKLGTSGLAFDKDTDLVPMDLNSVWKAMEECQILGFTKLIGVSNFSIKKLQAILSQARIPPAVNQVEMNPLWQQKKLREYCEEKGIHIVGYSPLGAKGTPWGSNKVMECDVLKQIAQDKGKTLAQICLRWVYEQGVSVLVKSFNKERIQENMDILDWKLNSEDTQKISEIPQHKGCLGVQFVSQNGPFKCPADLWDEEV